MNARETKLGPNTVLRIGTPMPDLAPVLEGDGLMRVWLWKDGWIDYTWIKEPQVYVVFRYAHWPAGHQGFSRSAKQIIDAAFVELGYIQPDT